MRKDVVIMADIKKTIISNYEGEEKDDLLNFYEITRIFSEISSFLKEEDIIDQLRYYSIYSLSLNNKTKLYNKIVDILGNNLIISLCSISCNTLEISWRRFLQRLFDCSSDQIEEYISLIKEKLQNMIMNPEKVYDKRKQYREFCINDMNMFGLDKRYISGFITDLISSATMQVFEEHNLALKF